MECKMNIFTLNLLINLIFLRDVTSWRSFEFYFHNVECARKSEIAAFVNCSLSNLPKQQRGLCFYLQFSQTVKRPKLDFLIQTLRPNQDNFVLANLTRIDGCQFLESRGILNIIAIIRKEFDKFSNMPKKCPVPKHSKVEVKDLILDPNNFPPYVPETGFMVIVRLWEDLKAVFEITVKGSATPRDRRIRVPMKKDSKKTLF